MKQPHRILLPVFLWCVLLCAALYLREYPTKRWYIVAAALAGSLLLCLLLWIIMRRENKRRTDREDNIFAENSRKTTSLIRTLDVPCALIQEDGNIVWRNDAFAARTASRNIRDVIPSYDPKTPLASFSFFHAGGAYLVKSAPVLRETTDRAVHFMYWIDRTDAAHYQRLYEERMPYVALVYVDNYEEMTSDIQFHRTAVLAETERLVAQFAQSLEGIYRRYESGRFIVIFEATRLAQMEEDRFALLESARAIETGTGATVTLSIAVGAADRLKASDDAARQAMDLALGRGGDQAVIKQGADYRFYGGKTQQDSMQSRVKARLFSKALRQLFDSAGDIFVMGHRNADMDCLGAALGVVACAKHIGSRAFIVLDSVNGSIRDFVDRVREDSPGTNLIVTPEQAVRMMRQTDVLVIVDTQRESMIASPELFAQATRVVLIDHHRRSTDHIDNATLHYLESRASSASELMTEVLQYFDDALRPSAFVSGALLAGIMLDTKDFAFNVSSRTFEAAAYLRRNGADITAVRELFEDDLREYIDCADAVRTAELLPGGVAVARVPDTAENPKLTAAKAADELIGIRDVQAAFVLAASDGIINVSGRSLGGFNVQLICEKLGGGGHLTMAGAQLEGTDMDAAAEQVKKAIEEYTKEEEHA